MCNEAQCPSLPNGPLIIGHVTVQLKWKWALKSSFTSKPDIVFLHASHQHFLTFHLILRFLIPCRGSWHVMVSLLLFFDRSVCSITTLLLFWLIYRFIFLGYSRIWSSLIFFFYQVKNKPSHLLFLVGGRELIP